MDLIKGYNSESDSTECKTEEIGRREVRQVYLITYSQVDTTKFPARESFAVAVDASFCAPSGNVLWIGAAAKNLTNQVSFITICP